MQIYKILLRQHNILRRNLEKCLIVLEENNFDIGFKDFLNCFLADLDEHHSVEESVIFPFAELKRIKTESLVKEHILIFEEIQEIKTILRYVFSIDTLREKRLEILNHLRRLYQETIPHLLEEENLFNQESINTKLNKKEERKLNKEILKFVQKDTPTIKIAYFIFSQSDEELKNTYKNMNFFLKFFIKNIVLKVNKDEFESQKRYYFNFK